MHTGVRGLSGVERGIPKTNEGTRCKKLGCALLIILALGGIALFVASLGAQQMWWRTTALNELTQAQLVITMVTSGVVGAISLILGIVVSIKRKKAPIESASVIVEPKKDEPKKTTGMICDATFWKEKWGLDVWGSRGAIPEMPQINWGEECPLNPGKKLSETSVLVLIPHKVSPVNVFTPFHFTMDTIVTRLLKERVTGTSLSYAQSVYNATSGKDDAYWVLITTEIVDGTKGKSKDESETDFKSKGYQLAHPIELFVAALFALDNNGSQLFSKEYTLAVDHSTNETYALKGELGLIAIHKEATLGVNESPGAVAVKTF